MDEPVTPEMIDIGARAYSSLVANDDKETNYYSDFPHEKVI